MLLSRAAKAYALAYLSSTSPRLLSITFSYYRRDCTPSDAVANVSAPILTLHPISFCHLYFLHAIIYASDRFTGIEAFHPAGKFAHVSFKTTPVRLLCEAVFSSTELWSLSSEQAFREYGRITMHCALASPRVPTSIGSQ